MVPLISFNMWKWWVALWLPLSRQIKLMAVSKKGTCNKYQRIHDFKWCVQITNVQVRCHICKNYELASDMIKLAESQAPYHRIILILLASEVGDIPGSHGVWLAEITAGFVGMCGQHVLTTWCATSTVASPGDLYKCDLINPSGKYFSKLHEFRSLQNQVGCCRLRRWDKLQNTHPCWELNEQRLSQGYWFRMVHPCTPLIMTNLGCAVLRLLFWTAICVESLQSGTLYYSIVVECIIYVNTFNY